MAGRIRFVTSLTSAVAIITVGFGALATAFSHDVWINREKRVNAQGEWCCNQHDCEPVSSEDVKENGVGFVLVSSGEVIPYSEAQVSGDHQYWRCRRPNKTVRCFFYPPPAS
jgi:hypothetical protein